MVAKVQQYCKKLCPFLALGESSHHVCAQMSDGQNVELVLLSMSVVDGMHPMSMSSHLRSHQCHTTDGDQMVCHQQPSAASS